MIAFLLFFEVLDKEPPIFDIWWWFLFIGVIGFLLSFAHRYLAIPCIIFATMICIFNLTEFWDPHINSSIWYEDATYLPQVYLAMLLSIVGPLLGAKLSSSRRKNWQMSNAEARTK